MISLIALPTSAEEVSERDFPLNEGFSGDAPLWPTQLLDKISKENLNKIVDTLSSKEYEGRLAGSPGDLKTSLFIAKEFQRYGLKPYSNIATQVERFDIKIKGELTKFFQPIPIETNEVIKVSRFKIRISGKNYNAILGRDYIIASDSPSVKIAAPVVFAGYGITDESIGYDDYKGVDAKGKVILIIQGSPGILSKFYTYKDKAINARKHGAIAILMATGPILSPHQQRAGTGQNPTAFFNDLGTDTNLPAFHLSPGMADKIVATAETNLSTLQASLEEGKKPSSVKINADIDLEVISRYHPKRPALNVIGFIEGRDPELSKEVVIIGAHHDHFGILSGELFFPGADDNASGTAVLLELARVISEVEVRPKRSILFVSFSAEEMGTKGAQYYVSNPLFPIDKTIAMINIDHAGVGEGRVTLGLKGLEEGTVLNILRESALDGLADIYGYFPGGDHAPFAMAGVSTIAIVSSGPHPDGHQITDTKEKVRPEIMELVGKVALLLSMRLADQIPPLTNPSLDKIKNPYIF